MQECPNKSISVNNKVSIIESTWQSLHEKASNTTREKEVESQEPRVKEMLDLLNSDSDEEAPTDKQSAALLALTESRKIRLADSQNARNMDWVSAEEMLKQVSVV